MKDDEIIYSTGWIQVSESEPDVVYVWDSESKQWILPEEMNEKNKALAERTIEDPFDNE